MTSASSFPRANILDIADSVMPKVVVYLLPSNIMSCNFVKFSSLTPKNPLAYAVVCLVWESTYLANWIGVSELPPATVAGIRFVLAGAIMLAYVRVRKLDLPRSPGDYRVIAIVGLPARASTYTL